MMRVMRAVCSAMIVAFLQGKQSPTVEFFGIDADPNVLAASWRVYFDYGAALADYRAKNGLPAESPAHAKA